MSMPSQIAILNTADDSVRKVELPGNMFPPRWRWAAMRAGVTKSELPARRSFSMRTVP